MTKKKKTMAAQSTDDRKVEEDPMGMDVAGENTPENDDNEDGDEGRDTVSDELGHPEFVTLEDVIEIQFDDENVPMDEEEDDDEERPQQQQQQPEEEESIPVAVDDMSLIKLESHQGPVYAVCAYVDKVSKQISILTGGGDDRAFFHRSTSSTTDSNHSLTQPTTTTAMNSKQLQFNHTDSISAVAWNLPFLSSDATTDTTNNPRLAAVGGYDGAIVLYDADTGDWKQTLEGPTDVECLAFHPKGGTVLLAGSAADGTLWMYHIPLNKCLQVFVGHQSSVTACQFTSDGRWALSTSSDGTLRVWAPRTGACKHVFQCGGTTGSIDGGVGLTCMALGFVGGDQQQQLVLCGSENGNAYVCHVGTKKIVATLSHRSPSNTDPNGEDDKNMELSVEAVGFSPSQPNWCATGGIDGILKIWDLNVANGTCRQTCSGGGGGGGAGITRLVWHPTLPLCFTSTTAGMVHLWDARNGRLLHSLTGHTDVLNDMDVQFVLAEKKEDRDPAIALVVTGSDDQTVRVFRVDIASIWNGANTNSSTSNPMSVTAAPILQPASTTTTTTKTG